MESEKRKREDDGEVDGKRAKGGHAINGGESNVTEEEVEEFFSILKRINVAVKYFQKANVAGRKVTGNGWRPSFLLEDFEGDIDVKNEGKRELGDLEEESVLDLNLEPISKEK
ncbi:hypothetical protein CRYUN_Cryun29cG0105000 [Craigia yunnanensis]